MDTFVEVYESALHPMVCDDVVDAINLGEDKKLTFNRPEAPHDKDDVQIYPSTVNLKSEYFMPEGTTSKIDDVLVECVRKYNHKYSILHNFDSDLAHYGHKLQKTKIGGGYHLWHCEVMGKNTRDRVLAYIIYLNDVTEGGETEFLYQSMRIKPKKGTVVIFPAYFTHTHRGNPPLSNEKYIATGWIEM